MFLIAIAAVVFHQEQEDSHADHRIQGLEVAHFPDLVDPVGASSVAEIA